MLGMHFAALGFHHVLVGAFLDGQGRGMLVDADAETGHRAGDSADVLQRMEVEGVALQQAAEVSLGLEHFLQLARRNVFPVHPVGLLHQLARGFQPRRVVEPVGEDHALVYQVAVDAVPPDAVADEIDGIEGQLVKTPRLLGAQGGEQIRVTQAVAAEDEAAITSRGAVADAVGLQHHHIGHAALGQAEGRGQAGQPSAEDADLGVGPAGMGGVGGPFDRGFVEGLEEVCIHEMALHAILFLSETNLADRNFCHVRHLFS
ncbi:hypothetical protein D3C76_948740 [compost metagenome]